MSLPPETMSAVTSAASKPATVVAQRLWPTMLFLVVMTLIALFGGRWWTNSIGIPWIGEVSYFIWFAGVIVVLLYGVWAFSVDIRIGSKRKEG